MLTGVKCAGCVGAMRFPKGKDRASMGLPPSPSAHVRWGERRAPVRSCGARHKLEGEVNRRSLRSGRDDKDFGGGVGTIC
jgi:hypothetical protein